jgi:glycosylphosphatidylinositol transamidase (GPIT) subunit GPI8
MSSEFKVNDQTNIALPIKNIVAIISAIVIAVWTYFGIVERLNRIETNEKLMAQDLLKKAEQTPKNQEMYMLIEYQAKALDKHSKQLEENVHTKVLIAQLEKKVDKLEKELDTLRGK